MIRSRREFMAHASAGGACLLTFTVAGCATKLSPAQARTANVPLRTLDAATVKTLEAVGEILLPGSAAEGLAQYIDHQLSGDPADSMLMIKYLRVSAPFADFYRAGLQSTERAAQSQFEKPLAELTTAQANALVTQMSAGHIEGWNGPPPGLFYFVLRNDAVDVMYGTQTGFEKLGVPYMAHIAPPTRWG